MARWAYTNTVHWALSVYTGYTLTLSNPVSSYTGATLAPLQCMHSVCPVYTLTDTGIGSGITHHSGHRIIRPGWHNKIPCEDSLSLFVSYGSLILSFLVLPEHSVILTSNQALSLQSLCSPAKPPCSLHSRTKSVSNTLFQTI